MLGLKIHYLLSVQVRILFSALKKENFKPVRTERSGSLRVAVNDLAGRKSKRAIYRFIEKSSLVRVVGIELLKRVYAVLLIWICGPVPSV